MLKEVSYSRLFHNQQVGHENFSRFIFICFEMFVWLSIFWFSDSIESVRFFQHCFHSKAICPQEQTNKQKLRSVWDWRRSHDIKNMILLTSFLWCFLLCRQKVLTILCLCHQMAWFILVAALNMCFDLLRLITKQAWEWINYRVCHDDDDGVLNWC